ncbi:MAG: type phosphodiesterase/nucleotide pyrophosphatase, partial [Bryobacterales bacterium]|nr:type phosphodiesterase/nucleotide pyrophosphatase [Bryobacterales bacterium]
MLHKSMRLVRALSAFLTPLLLFHPAQGAGPRKLIVICIDGLDARFLKDTDKVHIKIPVIRKLMRQGVVSDGVIGVLPGGSWAADTTIVTGLTPAQHLVSA